MLGPDRFRRHTAKEAAVTGTGTATEYGIIFGFPVWAGNFTPPLRTFILDQKDALKGKRFSAFACQSGSGGGKALSKLAGFLRIKSFDETAVFIDPKAKHSSETEEAIASFCGRLGA